jgi:transposase
MSTMSKFATNSDVHMALRARKVDEDFLDEFHVVHPDAAGIDIGSETHYVSVPEDRDAKPVRTFGCFTPDLKQMAVWLGQCGIRHVIMESTGVYWMPAYQVLTEAGFDVRLVDARHARHVPGRKTDVWDCRWLRKLHTFGLLNGCFLPPDEITEMRAYWRHRSTLVAATSEQTLRMHKSLEMMNLQLHKVLRDVTGVTGMLIIRAIVAGERDPVVLAQHRQSGVKHNEETFIKALTGNYQREYIFTLRQALACYDFMRVQIKECDDQLQTCLAAIADKEPSNPDSPDAPAPTEPKPQKSLIPAYLRRSNDPGFDLRSELIRIAGVDLTRIDGISILTGLTIITEIGPDFSAFPTEKRFGSWLGLCPNNRVTGGKVRSTKSRKVQSRVAMAFRLGAQSLHNSNSALGAFYRRLRARLGAPKAITATAYKLARLVWRMMTYGTEYVDTGQAAYEKKTEERSIKSLTKRATSLGYALVAINTGEVLSGAG